jgi:hypothetical protein
MWVLLPKLNRHNTCNNFSRRAYRATLKKVVRIKKLGNYW